MNMKKLLILMLALALLTPLGALAGELSGVPDAAEDPAIFQSSAAFAPGARVYVNRATARMTYNPRKLSFTKAVLVYGDGAQVLEARDGWMKVADDAGRQGWCRPSAFTDADPNHYDLTVYVQAETLPLYSRPVEHIPEIAILRRNDALTLRAMFSGSSDWLRVEWQGRTGFIRMGWIDDQPWAPAKTVWSIQSNAVPAYTCAGDFWLEGDEGGSYNGSIHYGQAFECLGHFTIPGDWPMVKLRSADGRIGYCPDDWVTDQDPNTLNQTVYTQVGGKGLLDTYRDIPARYREEIPVNTPLMLVALNPLGDQARVLYKGEYRYVSAVYIGPEKVEGPGRKMLCAGTLYHTPNVGDEFALLPEGTPVYLVGVRGSGAKVTTIPQGDEAPVTGYVHPGCLSPYDENVAPAGPIEWLPGAEDVDIEGK